MIKFIHIPKTAGQSITQLFDDLLSPVGWELISHQKSLRGEHRGNEGEFVAFVRNPYDRLISSFFFSKHNIDAESRKNERMYREIYNRDFESFVNILDKRIFEDEYLGEYFAPQVRFVEKFPDVKICRFENVEKEIHGILGNPVKIPHINKSSHEHYSTYYTEELRRKVFEFYREDFVLFDYPEHIGR